MDILAALLAVATAFLSGVYITKLWVRRAKLHRQINTLPGPPTYPIIGTTYLFFGISRNEMLKKATEIAEKYWPIFRTWLGSVPEVNLIKPEHFEAVISCAKHLDKSGFYKLLNPWLGNGLITSSGQKWQSHRKMITPAFHLSVLESFIEVFSEKCDILMDKLEQKADGSSFDVFPYITRCTLDIICETAMGVPIYAQEDTDSEYVRAVSDIVEISVRRRERIWLHPAFIFFRTSSGRRYKKCLDVLQGFTDRVIQERKAVIFRAANSNHESSDEDVSFGIRKKKAFLDLLLEISGKDFTLSDEEIREEVDTFMFAGHDTTAVSISWALFMLGHHPEVQEKVYAELADIFQGSQRSPTVKDLHEMKYLEMVIKETLRLYPAVPFIQRVLSEDIRIDDYDVPAGTTVSIMIFFANRNTEYFPNPEEFNPDNFLPERVQKRHHFAFIPFSAGPRNCIGQKFALMEGKTILSSIIRKFEIRSVEKKEDVIPVPVIVLRPENSIKMTLTLRP